MRRLAGWGPRGSRKPRLLAAALAVLSLALALGAASALAAHAHGVSSKTSAHGLVGLLLPDVTSVRWNSQDAPFFVAAMKKYAPGATVKVVNARGSVSGQLAQAENMLTAGAKVLVVAPQDGKAAAQIVAVAHKRHVPVVAYARPILNSPVDYFVSADVLGMGKIQGQWIAQHTKKGDNIVMINGDAADPNAGIIHRGNMIYLGQLFKSGARHKVADQFTPSWDPAKAQTEMEQILTRTQNNVDAVLVANDGMASGVIAALRAAGLAGKIPVTGLDASVGGLQLIIKGDQGMSVLIPIERTAQYAARTAAALVQGKKPPKTLYKAKTFNGKVRVPTAFIPVQLITKNTIGLVIKDGDLTKAEICKGMPAGDGPC